MRFAMMKEDVIDFARLLSSLQFTMNNSKNASIELSLNEILYKFKSVEFIDLLVQNDVNQRANDENSSISIKKERVMFRKKVEDVISMTQILQKIRYNSRHLSVD